MPKGRYHYVSLSYNFHKIFPNLRNPSLNLLFSIINLSKQVLVHRKPGARRRRDHMKNFQTDMVLC